MEYQKRINEIRIMMKKQYIFGMYITSPENVFYLSGFTGFGDARLFITMQNCYIITDSRYTVQVGIECPDYRFVLGNAENVAEIQKMVNDENISVIGFEKETILYQDYAALKEIFQNAEIVGIGGYFTGAREVKEAAEIQCIEKACEIASKSLQEIIEFIRPGAVESEIAAELEYRMKKNGASERSFDTIVASGVRSAMPHGVASHKKIEYADSVTIDFGCIYNHYCSDMTRTFFVGKPCAQMQEVYRVVYDAQLAAIENFCFGMTGAELDGISREIISESGYGPNFGHSLGHGVGIEIHEGAAVSPRNHDALQNNTVFSIEPGIYIENLGGVRIEDLVVLENQKLKVMTSGFDKKMLVL